MSLRAVGITKSFGGLTAVEDVSFEIEGGDILGLIGPNGSGKTTLLNVINGVHRPDSGRVYVDDRLVTGLRPHQMAEAGIMRTFQTTRVFETMTVWQNMMIPTTHNEPPNATEDAERLLDLVGLDEFSDRAASELSGGQQKLLEFARAMMPKPEVVLMDEPFAGIHPEIKRTLFERIREAAVGATAFVIVSHEIPELMGLSKRVICLSEGSLIADGTPTEVSEHQDVIEAYLGTQSSRRKRA